MSKIELEPREIFGYALTILGVIILIYTYIQAGITIGTLMSFIGKLMPNPTIALYTQASAGIPGFAETLSWFFMLTIQTLIGFFIASIGVKIAKKS